MAQGRKLTIADADGTVVVGKAIEIPVALLRTLEVDTFNKSGVVLVGGSNTDNGRAKVHIMHDGTPVEYTIGLYIQRGPLDETESQAIANVKAERDAKTAERKKEDADKLSREKQEAFRLGRETTLETLRNIDATVSAARAFQTVTGGR